MIRTGYANKYLKKAQKLRRKESKSSWFHRGVVLYLLALLTALCGLAVWGCFGLNKHAIVAFDNLSAAGAGLTQTAQYLNDPDKGTIKMIDEDAGAAKSLIIHADLVARHEQQQLNTWDARGTELFNNANGAVTDLRGVFTSGKATLDQATETLKIINDPKTGLRVVLEHTDGTIQDLGSLTPDIKRATKGLADTSEQTAGIGQHLNATTGDLQHALHPILNPDPCTTRGCKIKRDLAKLKVAGPTAEGLYYLIQIFKDF